ncbi:hypothetical protein [Achromobacter denitrificans]|uniref:hypothetical protein n=1 Tax=Achromobacter denitrificans TaxID=32002 RepID=UPI003B9E3C21
MDYPGEFKTQADIQAAERHQQWARDAHKPAAGPNATTDEIVAEMLVTGGNFAKHLARLWHSADPVNRIRLTTAFRAEFDKHREDYKLLKHYRSMARDAELASRN